jgi:tRNA 2-thiouridine synthesizing protein A
MKVIDCLGEMCPIPLILLEKEIRNLKSGEAVMIVTDHSCSLNSIKDFCLMHQLFCKESEVISGVWEIAISNKPFPE